MDEKERFIEIFYLPNTKLPNEVIKVVGKAGYAVHEGQHGAIGYRLFSDGKTILIPKEIVHKIEVRL